MVKVGRKEAKSHEVTLHVTWVCCARPAADRRSAEEYGYGGVILGSAGHVRVTVSENEAKVDYVRSIVPGVTKAGLPNATVEHSYTISPRNRQR